MEVKSQLTQEVNDAISRLRKAGKRVDVQNHSGKITIILNGKSVTPVEAVEQAKSLPLAK